VIDPTAVAAQPVSSTSAGNLDHRVPVDLIGASFQELLRMQHDNMLLDT